MEYEKKVEEQYKKLNLQNLKPFIDDFSEKLVRFLIILLFYKLYYFTFNKLYQQKKERSIHRL